MVSWGSLKLEGWRRKNSKKCFTDTWSAKTKWCNKYCPLKIEMEPENHPIEKENHISTPSFFGFHVSFRVCTETRWTVQNAFKLLQASRIQNPQPFKVAFSLGFQNGFLPVIFWNQLHVYHGFNWEPNSSLTAWSNKRWIEMVSDQPPIFTRSVGIW